jgi:hypothetical protein
MSNTGMLGAICYEQEVATGEIGTTAATYRIPHIGSVDISKLTQKRIEPGHVEQYMNAGRSWILGGFDGQFETLMDLTGHGSTTAGAGSIAARETFLGKIIGNVGAYVAGTTLTGGTANIPTTTASGTFPAGGMTFIGALNDGDGDGQAYLISTHSAANLTLLTDLRGAPVNGALMSGGVMHYTGEAPTGGSYIGQRFLLQTANLQVLAHGCAPVSWSLTGLGPAGRPQIRTTWQVARWAYRSDTFPNTTASDTFLPTTVSAGSLWVNDKGTTTNVAGAACRTVTDFQIDVTAGMEIIRAPGGYVAGQEIRDYKRTPSKFKVSWVEAADAATTTPVVPSWTNPKTLVYTLNTVDGKRVAIAMPNVCPAEDVPAQFVDSNLNRIRFTGYAYTNDVTTNDLTLSAFRMLSA